MRLVPRVDDSYLSGSFRRATEDIRPYRATRARWWYDRRDGALRLGEASTTEGRFLHVLISDCIASNLPMQAGRAPTVGSSCCVIATYFTSYSLTTSSTPQMNQPLEALRHIQCSMDLDQKHHGKSADIFVVNPYVAAIVAASPHIDRRLKGHYTLRLLYVSRGQERMIYKQKQCYPV